MVYRMIARCCEARGRVLEWRAVLGVMTYQWYLMVHVLAVVVWVGGGVTMQLFTLRLMRDTDRNRMAGFLKDVEWIGTRVYAPASLVVLGSGFLLVHEADIGFPFWVVFGLAAVAYTFLSDLVFLSPESKRIGTLVASRGQDDAEVRRRLGRILALSRFENLLLLLVVAGMTIKPFA